MIVFVVPLGTVFKKLCSTYLRATPNGPIAFTKVLRSTNCKKDFFVKSRRAVKGRFDR